MWCTSEARETDDTVCCSVLKYVAVCNSVLQRGKRDSRCRKRVSEQAVKSAIERMREIERIREIEGERA